MTTFDQFAAKLQRLDRALDGPDKARLLTDLGVRAKADVTEAVEADLGDRSMSHWRRGDPIDLASRFDVAGDAVTVTPTPRTRGPWRVMEDGRRPGGAFDLVQVGRRRKDGTRRARSRGRNQGATEGKQTWTEAAALIEDRTPKRVHEAVQRALRQIF